VEAFDKKAYDGSHIYSEQNSIVDQEKIYRGFDFMLNYAMQDFSFDEKSEDVLNRLINYLQGKEVTVTLVLAPYHPELYARMRNEKPLFLELETKFRDIAKLNNIRIIGSYNPHVVGCLDREFYDGMHSTAECMKKLVETIKLEKMQ